MGDEQNAELLDTGSRTTELPLPSRHLAASQRAVGSRHGRLW